MIHLFVCLYNSQPYLCLPVHVLLLIPVILKIAHV